MAETVEPKHLPLEPALEEINRLLEEEIPPRSLFEKYKPKEEWFLRPESARGIHGIGHEARVMIWQEILSKILIKQGITLDQEALRWAAVTHDTQRIHDGRDSQHGQRSTEWINSNSSLPVPPESKDIILYLNTWHASSDYQAPKMTPELAIFKDADGLDRARLGDLIPTMLRHNVSRQTLIAPAKALYENSFRKQWEDGVGPFEAVMEAAVELGLILESPKQKESLLLSSTVRRERLTLTQVCKQEGCSEGDLPRVFRKKIDKILEFTKTNTSIDSRLHPQIDFVYSCWAATRNLDQSHQLLDFASSLDNFDTFVATYAQEASRAITGRLIQRIDRFVTEVIHPSKVIEAFPKDHRMRTFDFGIYDYRGEWIKLPRKHYHAGVEYVDRQIIKEIIELRKLDHTRADLFHATGSAVLGTVAKHSALLSAAKLKQLEESIKTGEYITRIGQNDHSVSGGKEGLANIYCYNYTNIAFGNARWFDEFHVAFGMSSDKVEEYLEQQVGKKVRLRSLTGGEGITVGSEIPLSLIISIYSNSCHLPQIREWAETNAPHARIISIEADRLIRARSTHRPSLWVPIHNWEPFLSQKAIIL